MKKILAVFAALIMVLCISACDGGKKETDKVPEVTTTADPNTIEVPDLSGLKRFQVEMKYPKLNFNFIEKYDDNAGEDEVISQSPEPSTRIKNTDEITVTISIGAKQVEVDDYTGRNIEDVKLLIDKQGLRCETQLVENESVPRNCVISTTPSARTRVDKGTVITCFVSLGSAQQEIRVPDMRGMSIEDATKLAKERGIGLKVVYDNTSSLEPGTVISQGVDPDTVVQPNDRIEVTIAGETAVKSTEITVTLNKNSLKDKDGKDLEGEFDVKYYIDGTLRGKADTLYGRDKVADNRNGRTHILRYGNEPHHRKIRHSLQNGSRFHTEPSEKDAHRLSQRQDLLGDIHQGLIKRR